jgi:hypothetical protein
MGGDGQSLAMGYLYRELEPDFSISGPDVGFATKQATCYN